MTTGMMKKDVTKDNKNKNNTFNKLSAYAFLDKPNECLSFCT